MAFFSNCSTEYFCLNLEPAKSRNSFVYELTKTQVFVSQYFIPRMLLASIAIFTAVICMSTMEYFEFARKLMSNSDQELLIVLLAGSATLIGFMEIFFFFWIKKNKIAPLGLSILINANQIFIMINKSRMAYLIFLLDMQVPFIALLALPGGLSQFAREAAEYGLEFKIFLIHLFLALIVFSAVLYKRIILLRWGGARMPTIHKID